ncbi:MAG TPA: hypothetical protein VE620_00145 [Myxococcales bacterium]|jgi:hypothetical protein|nr:hypothetical protein [Myxococcales bacterium]
MAEAQPARRGFPKPLLWLLVLGLLAAVWWLASERNLRRFSWAADGPVLVISKGRFFPLGMARIASDDPQLGKVYGPIPLPQGAKVGEQEFEDQTSLDRALFDAILPWAKADVQKGDEASIAQANQLLDRANLLPGLTAEQHQQLSALRGDLSFTAAKAELLQAAKLVLSARRKLQAVEEGGGEHGLEAGPLLRGLEGIQGLLEDAGGAKSQPARPTNQAAPAHTQPSPTPSDKAAAKPQ